MEPSDKLRSELNALFGHTPRVHEAVDTRMYEAARTRLSRAARRRATTWTLVKWAGTAAAVGLAFLIPTQLSYRSAPTTGIARSGDVNTDGAVDILDAFKLARALRDGDTTISTADIASATAAAVKLGGGA